MPPGYATKILRVMKLTVVILIAAIVQVSASSYAQKVTLKQKNAKLETIFEQIYAQSGYSFIYNAALLEDSKLVSVNLKNASLKEALDRCFADQSLTYEIQDNAIVIKEKSILQYTIKQLKSFFSRIDIHGRVIDENGKGLQGAVIRIKDSNKTAVTESDGYFILASVDDRATLVISYLGYEPQEVKAQEEIGTIKLKPSAGELNEVAVYSTGYQDIPKERATGAFTQVDNKTINRSVGVNILDRLDGVTSGLLLNKNLTNGANNATVSIRGRSTLFANAEPLIVLDGFPYEGTINQINPADINTIDVLKDAAAASIWGTRASNGVIVITTKKGKNNQKLTIGLSSTLTIGNKPNLYYTPQISSSDFIDLEKFLFLKGYFNSRINSGYAPISQAVEILNLEKNNTISNLEANARLNTLKTYDIRSDLNHYLYRTSVNQQYGLNISGGNENNRYYISGGYDKNLENSISNNYDRLTLNANNTFSLLKNKIEISEDINFSSSKTNSRYTSYTPTSPYDRLADAQGNSLPVVDNLRLAYVDTVGHGKLLDWHYRPKDELAGNMPTQLTQYKIKLGINYKILNGLNLSANYQYLKETNDQKIQTDLNSYYTRNLINKYSSITDGVINYNIPLGNFFEENLSTIISKIFRVQINYIKKIATDHEINAIAGYEGGDSRTSTNQQDLYGYDPGTQTNENSTINPLNFYPYYYQQLFSSQIQTAPSTREFINITQSYYANASYIYRKRYIVSGSARRDESNLFGVKSNQKGVPLWSTGLAWIINQESFYNADWLPSLKLRATYGFNGNLDKTTTGLLTVQNYGFVLNNPFGSSYSTIINPPNPTLQWEKVKTWNLGLDYTFRNNRISGSLDIYQKNGDDLIGNSPIAMQSGVTEFKGNNANLRTKGLDLTLNSRNLTGEFKWFTSFLLNYSRDKVISYKIKPSYNYEIASSNYSNPLIGYPYYSIFSFPSAGLDKTGAPQGYFNGIISKNYSKILLTLDPSQLKFNGSASPIYFGNIINTFNYKNLELSINVVYKLDYYFRRLNVFSGSTVVYNVSNYTNRWQKPGDELVTRIPALRYPSGLSNNFFNYSEDLVERGDHIRLQDIRLSYQLLGNILSKSPFKNAKIFIYGRNLGILWRANKNHVDPDYGTSSIPQSFSCSLGVNFSF